MIGVEAEVEVVGGSAAVQGGVRGDGCFLLVQGGEQLDNAEVWVVAGR
jgi:hypothetical protein